MKVSVIVPVYNVSKYIEECLQSIVQQTYDKLECILVDDCGTDDSVDICERFVASYKGNISFRIVHHERNRGLSAARNTGTDIATGEYVYYLDSDDKLYPECIELLVGETLKRHDVEMVIGGIVANPTSKYYSYEDFGDIDYIDDPAWMRSNYFNAEKGFPAVAWNKLVKRQFLINNNISFKEGLIHEDELWSFWMSLRLQRIAFVHQPTYYHLDKREGSIMNTASVERDLKHFKVIFFDVLNNLESPYKKNVILYYLLRFIPLYRRSHGRYNYNDLYRLFLKKIREEKLYCFSLFFLFFKLRRCGRAIRWLFRLYSFLQRHQLIAK